MSENPLQVLFQTFEKVSYSIQHHLSSLIGLHLQPASSGKAPLFSVSSSFHESQSAKVNSFVQPEDTLLKVKSATPVTKEELGKATWTFLHALAAQYPDNPTRQQKKDVKELMGILSRMYPCKECADHFKEVLRANPVQVGSHAEFSQWLCHVHNVVNRSLSKPIFPCERVDARWGKLECEKTPVKFLEVQVLLKIIRGRNLVDLRSFFLFWLSLQRQMKRNHAPLLFTDFTMYSSWHVDN